MNKDEALKMAIEAMDNSIVSCEDLHHTKKDQHKYNEDCPVEKRWNQTINDCKEALEAEQVCQAQKPVGYWNGSTSFDYYKYDADGFIVSEFEIHDWKPLYTHPHQWQGLTDDEIEYACSKCDKDFSISAFKMGVIWAEQALKEKNT